MQFIRNAYAKYPKGICVFSITDFVLLKQDHILSKRLIFLSHVCMCKQKFLFPVSFLNFVVQPFTGCFFNF